MPYIRFNAENDPNKRFFSSISDESIFVCPSHRAKQRELEGAKSVADHIFALAKAGKIAPVFLSVQVTALKGDVLYEPAKVKPASSVAEEIPTSVIAFDGLARIVPVDIENIGKFWRYKYFFRDRKGEGRMGEIVGNSKLNVVEKIFDTTWCLGNSKQQDDLRELVLTFQIDTSAPPVKSESTVDELQRVSAMTLAYYDDPRNDADSIVTKAVADPIYRVSLEKVYKAQLATDSQMSASRSAAHYELNDIPGHRQFVDRLGSLKAVMQVITEKIAANEAAEARQEDARRRLEVAQ